MSLIIFESGTTLLDAHRHVDGSQNSTESEQEFFQRLMNLFKICEDLENIEGLHMLYKIIRGMIILNSQQIFEKIFGDELIMDVIGCLESLRSVFGWDLFMVENRDYLSHKLVIGIARNYASRNSFFGYFNWFLTNVKLTADEPEVPHAHHRNFLNEHVVFKEAIPIKDRIVLSKIHQTYRVGYIKDAILPRALDEATIATLNLMIHANNATVVALLKDDSTFIQELFSRLRSPKTDVESKKKLVYFLHEFCTLSKSLQMVQQLRLFRELVNEGIIDIIIDILHSDDKRLVLTGTDILILFLNQDPNLLRSYVSRPEGMSLLGLLVQGMITDFGDDMHCQFLEILRCLLDSYTLSGSQRDTIVDIFYDKHLSQLIEVIITSCSMEEDLCTKSVDSNDKKFSKAKPEILMNICDLLRFCVLHHPLKLKGNFLVNNVFDKVLLLTKRREKYLVVAAVRFFRTIISRNDDHLSNYIVKHNLLKYVIDVFVENGDRYNLLNSAVLDLLEYIRKENLKILIKYVMESFGDKLGKFEHLASVQAFKLRYDQALDNSGTSPSLALEDSMKKFDERAPEKEEEDYFNEYSDEEDTASASVSRTHQSPARPGESNGSPAASPSLSSRGGGLVDYDDDDDDEDYKPPPRRQSDVSDDDEETLESLSLKRKLMAKEEPGLLKKQRFDKHSKSKEVFASLCSTLSQKILPNKKAASAISNIVRARDDKSSSDKENHQEGKDANLPEDCPANLGKDEGTDGQHSSCWDGLHKTSDNGEVGSDDLTSLRPSSGIDANGS
ncbi:Serine/threonine-protein phosphatase 4 regulatory subunit 3B-like protein [Drosera capensis]